MEGSDPRWVPILVLCGAVLIWGVAMDRFEQRFGIHAAQWAFWLSLTALGAGMVAVKLAKP